MKKIILKRLESKKTCAKQDGTGNYVRINFNATDESGNEISVRANISEQQWEDLKESFQLQQNDDEIITNKPQTIEFDENATTENGNSIFKHVKDTYKGKSFEYFQLSSSVLISHDLIKKTVFPKFDKF